MHHNTSSSESLPYGESSHYKQQAKENRKSVDLTGKGKTAKFDDVVGKFDAKLNEINKGYLGFFNERIHIEEQYVDSLQRLYVKSRAFDSLYEDGIQGPLPTSRQAWREVRDHTEREADTRRAYCEALQGSVVRILQDLATVQGRIKGRIKEDLERATDMYIDQAEHTLPKLKKAYFKKCQEAEDQKRQDSAIALQAKLLSDPIHADKSYSPLGTPSYDGHVNPYASPPSQTGPLPAMGNPALVNNMTFDTDTSGGRKRSGSVGQTDKAKEVFGDLASTGKRGLNAFMARFGGDKDKDKSPEEGFVVLPPTQSGSPLGREGPVSQLSTNAAGHSGAHQRAPSAAYGAGRVPDGIAVKASAMKGVKLKREAEEADKAYREAVFHLESLRLRRNKIQASASDSFDNFTAELCGSLKAALMAYVDCSSATAATNAQMVEHPRKAIESVDIARDVAIFSGPPHLKSLNFAAPILYENYYVGQCRSLIFGVSLNDYEHQRSDKGYGQPPGIVLKCIAELDARALDMEGIHRINGRVASVQQVVHEIEQDEKAFNFTHEHEVSVISAVLKKYCRELPEPIFNFPLADRIRYTENRESHISSNFSAIRARLSRMPPIHQSTLKIIVEHLSRVAAHSAQNKMDAKNLAVIFGKTLFGEDELPKDGDLKNFKIAKDTVVEDMINYAPLLFCQEESDAPVLPAGAALSRSGSLSYQPVHTGFGSSHTRAKLPKVDTLMSPSSTSHTTTQRINLNDEAWESPEQPGPSRSMLPPGAASPTVTSPPNINREFTAPPLPPRRPADTGSMHTRRPSYHANSPHADEMGGTAPNSAVASTILTRPDIGQTLLSADDQAERDSQISTTAVQSEPVSEGEDTGEPVGIASVSGPVASTLDYDSTAIRLPVERQQDGTSATSALNNKVGSAE